MSENVDAPYPTHLVLPHVSSWSSLLLVVFSAEECVDESEDLLHDCILPQIVLSLDQLDESASVAASTLDFLGRVDASDHFKFILIATEKIYDCN